MQKKDALNTVLDFSEKQMRVALVDLVLTFYPTKELNEYDLEAILQAAKSHGQKQ